MITGVHTVKADLRNEEINRIRNGGIYPGSPSLVKAERLGYGFELLQYKFRSNGGRITASVVLIVEPLSDKAVRLIRDGRTIRRLE